MPTQSRKLFRLFLLILLAVTGRPLEGLAQRKESARQKLRQAERVADHLIERFHETLNFDPIFEEFFVTNPGLRKRVIVLGENKELQDKISESIAEQNFKALMTFMHLFAEYRLTADGDELPSEIEQAISDSKGFKPSANEDEIYSTTVAEMERSVAALNHASSLFRTYLAPEVFQSRTYRDNIAEARRAAQVNFHNVPRIEWGNEKHGIKASVPIYIIRRELFDYYFIEENGAFKVFYIDLLPNLKLIF